MRRTVWLTVRIAEVVCLCFASYFLIEGARLLREVRMDAADLHDRTVALEEAEQKHLADEFKEVKKATAGIKDLFEHTDVTLNGTKRHPGVIPRLGVLVGKGDVLVDSGNKLLVQETADLHLLATTANDTVASLQPVIVQLGKDADALAVTLNDPHIPEMIANLDAASRELAESAKQLTAMLESGKATAQDVQKVADKVAYEYTKTKNLAWALFKELLGLSAQGAQLFK